VSNFGHLWRTSKEDAVPTLHTQELAKETEFVGAGVKYDESLKI